MNPKMFLPAFLKKPRPSHLEDVTAILENPGTGFSASKAFFKKDISNGEG
jgi:hypothetical protein